MIAPLAVENTEQDRAFELPHGILAADRGDLLLALLVRLLRVVDEDLFEFVGRDVVALTELVLAHHFSRVQLDRIERTQSGPQLVDVPVLGVTLLGRAVDIRADDLGDHLHDLLAMLGALEDGATLGVDDLALLVHHLVVLEDVLADLEVLLLDLGLRAADGLGDHLRLDRDVVGQVDAVHDRLEGRAVEASHEFVAEREVEP